MPESSELMHPVLLSFHDSSLEAEFDKYAWHNQHHAGDLRFFFVTACAMFSVGTKTVFEQDMRLLPAVPFYCSGVFTVLLWRTYIQSSAERVLQLRPVMSIFLRLCIAATVSFSTRYIEWMFKLQPHLLPVILQFLLASETFGNFPYAFGITIKFWMHLPTHLAAYLIFLFDKAPRMCEKLSLSEGAAVFSQLEAAVDELFEFCLAFLKSTVGVFDLTTVPKASCLHASAFLMTFVSIGVVSFILWRAERRMRLEFLEMRMRFSDSPRPKSTSAPLDCTLCLIATAVAAIYWRYSKPLPYFLNSVSYFHTSPKPSEATTL